MPEPITAQIAYDGEALRTGSMDVRDLAPALLAVGDFLQAGNRILNGDRAEVAVKVRSDFKTGSFQIHFELVQSLASQAHMFFSNEHLKTAKEIAQLLGLLTGGGGGIIGVLKLLKLVKGKRPIKGTTLANGNIQITVEGDNNQIEVKQEVVQMANDPSIQKSAADIIKPLANPGIDTFEVRENKDAIETYTREDLPAFQLTTESQDLKTSEEYRVTPLEVIKPSFEESLSWVFSDGAGGRVNAYMKDSAFLEKLKRHEISFTKGDILTVRMRIRSLVSSQGLHTENAIVEVKSFTNYAKLPLFLAVDEPKPALPPAPQKKPRKGR